MRRRRLTFLVILAVAVVWVLTCRTLSPATHSAMAEELLQHELASPASYLAQNLNYQPPHFLYVVADDQPVDPSMDTLNRISTAQNRFLPGSSWTLGHGTRVIVLPPKPLGFGLYLVGHNYYCGMLCSSDNVAVMFYDSRNWHVVASFTTRLS